MQISSAPFPSWSSLLEDAHTRHAARPALLTDAGTMTYADLLDAAGRVAAALDDLGVGAGDRVVIALDNSPAMAIVERALALWGRIRVAVSARLHPEEIAYIAANCKASLVLCEPRHLDDDAAGFAAIAVSARPHPRARLALADLLDHRGPPPPRPEARADDIVSLMYTSGTTGRPKGAINTQSAWAAMATGLRRVLPAPGPGDILLHVAPMSHFSGSVASAYACSGAAIATLPRFEPASALRHAAAIGATCMPVVPTMLADLVRAAESANAPIIPKLRVLPYGGAAVSPDLLRRAASVFGGVLVQLYGMSEALIPVTCLGMAEHGPGDDETPRLQSAGRPVQGVSLRLDDAQDGVGEVCIRGPNVMAGYWDDAARRREALDQDGWLHTGDLGRIDADGRLTLVDRRKEVIITGGFNVYPSEVERVIRGLAGVDDVAVIGIPHERWGEAVAALVQPAAGATITEAAILNACRAHLASYKKPLRIEMVAALPRTSTGKIDKRTLRDAHWAGRSRKIGE
jgi:acyl-CoA synthetase (AMP-forming)/AMP-acid ligase II